MKLLMITMLSFLSVASYASCESRITEGQHTGLSLEEAKSGALEDAIELCYPGKAEKSLVLCESIIDVFSSTEKYVERCRQQVVCTLCGEDLNRKLEALN